MPFNTGDVVAASYATAIGNQEPIPFEGGVIQADQVKDRYAVSTPFGFAAVFPGSALTLVSSGGVGVSAGLADIVSAAVLL